MKAFAHSVLVVLLCLPFVSALTLADASTARAGGAIDKVVTMLEDMLKKSEEDGKKDKEAYEKFATYCKDNTDDKTKSIEDATENIALLSNKIEELQGSTGSLSTKCATLKEDMAANEEAREMAKTIRENENKAFKELKKDSLAAISQMDEALKTLSAVGADQTMAEGADHDKFMGKFKGAALATMGTSVKKALVAATSILSEGKRQHVESLLQKAPFTGTYTAQSGQVVGILKNMKDTFADNLATAEDSEKRSKEAYDKLKKTLDEEYADMEKSYGDKQAKLGKNDGELSSKKTQLGIEEKTKADDEDFLEKLTEMCEKKAKDYEIRRTYWENENMALSKAIAILGNDMASEKFAKNDATFLQLSASRHLQSNSPKALRQAALQLLQGVPSGSRRVRQVELLLQAGNPFTSVLSSITKMLKLIKDEQAQDDAEKKWCEDTTKDNKKNKEDTEDDLDKIQDKISSLNDDIDDPKSGLKAQIKETEGDLALNQKNQGEESDTRRKENIEYQADCHNMEDSKEIIEEAVDVLTKYYDAMDNEQFGFIQKGKRAQEDPAPPDTFEGKYKGQSETGKKVIGMLEDIIEATVKELNEAHAAEEKAQHAYEDSMAGLVKDEEDYQDSLATLKKDLATKEKELENKYQEETETEKELTSIKRYIEKLKPGCDFVVDKYDDRKTSRNAEKKALEGARTKLKGTPAFKKAVADAKEAGLGDCKEKCEDESGAECKACLKGVSVPGFCAGHPGHKGC